MVDNSIIYELKPCSSHADRMELLRMLPAVLDFLKTKHGLDLATATTEYLQHLREYQNQQADLKKTKETEEEKISQKIATESYRLLFENFAPYVNGQRVAWGYRFELQETTSYPKNTTKSIEQEIIAKNVIPDGTVLTSKEDFLNSIEKMVDNVGFIMPVLGVYYEQPTFQIKRVKF